MSGLPELNELFGSGIELPVEFDVDIDLVFPTDDPAVSEFRVTVDTREQAPYHFTGIRTDDGRDLIVPLVHQGLESGDYSIEGHESQIAVERKSLSDFYGSISRERERFEREFERLNKMRVALVVIEADWEAIMHPEGLTRVLPKVATRTIASWMIRYPLVHWMPCPSRRFAEVFTYRFLEMYWRQLKHDTNT